MPARVAKARGVSLWLLLWAESLAYAGPYEGVRIDQGPTQGILWVKAPPQEPVRGVVVVIPGAQMTASRYTWLSEALVSDGYAAIVIEAGLQWIRPPGAPDRQLPARYVTIPHALAAVDYAQHRWPDAASRHLIGIGHSLGGAVLLELLDPTEAARNPNTRAPGGFTGVAIFDAAIVMGTSLQSQVGSMELPYRSETRTLTHPARTRVLLIAGEHDGMARPDLMMKTAARYSPPIELTKISGANHLGWSPGLGPMDRPDLDGKATVAQEVQIRRTLEKIRQFLRRQ